MDIQITKNIVLYRNKSIFYSYILKNCFRILSNIEKGAKVVVHINACWHHLTSGQSHNLLEVLHVWPLHLYVVGKCDWTVWRPSAAHNNRLDSYDKSNDKVIF